MNMETLGERLRQTRGELSQAEFAAKIGVHKDLVGKYERNLNIPGGDVLARIRDVFGTDINWLLTGFEPPPGWDSPEYDSALPPHANEIYSGLDESLLEQIGRGISAAYRDENARIETGQLMRLAARIYADLADFAPEERPVALKGILTQLRRDLRSPPLSDDTKQRA